VASITTALALVVGSFCAYALARLKLRGKFVILGIVLSITTFPQIAIAAPLFKLWSDIGIFDTYIGLIIPYLTFALPLAIFILVSFFREIPKDLEEAALVDGATRFQAFRKVVVPLAAPGLATAAILTFIAAWNEFLLAVTLTATTASRTVPAEISFFTGATEHQVPYWEHRGRFSGHLGTVDPARAALPEAHRGRSDRGRRQGLDRGTPERPEVEPYP
jgi:ABC-type sugar transport system, permease component